MSKSTLIKIDDNTEIKVEIMEPGIVLSIDYHPWGSFNDHNYQEASLSPKEAREIATLLNKTADEVEGKV